MTGVRPSAIIAPGTARCGQGPGRFSDGKRRQQTRAVTSGYRIYSGLAAAPDWPLLPPLPGIPCKNTLFSCTVFRKSMLCPDIRQSGRFAWNFLYLNIAYYLADLMSGWTGAGASGKKGGFPVLHRKTRISVENLHLASGCPERSTPNPKPACLPFRGPNSATCCLLFSDVKMPENIRFITVFSGIIAVGIGKEGNRSPIRAYF